MKKDRLFLIQPGFVAEGQEGLKVCPTCNQIEGLLASFPQLTLGLDIVRVGFARPRELVIEEIGEENQGLPVLVLYDDIPDDLDRANANGFTNDLERILALLRERHGFPAFL